MALTKARTSLYSAQTLTASTADTTSSAVNMSAAYAGLLNITLTNGATGPTIPAQARVQVACDTSGTLWADLCTLVGSTANSAVSYFSVELPSAAQAFRIIAGSNTAQNVTLNADYSLVTSL
jgi:hypothetical protein